MRKKYHFEKLDIDGYKYMLIDTYDDVRRACTAAHVYGLRNGREFKTKSVQLPEYGGKIGFHVWRVS